MITKSAPDCHSEIKKLFTTQLPAIFLNICDQCSCKQQVGQYPTYKLISLQSMSITHSNYNSHNKKEPGKSISNNIWGVKVNIIYKSRMISVVDILQNLCIGWKTSCIKIFEIQEPKSHDNLWIFSAEFVKLFY